MVIDNIIRRPPKSKCSNLHVQERGSVAVLQVMLVGSHASLSQFM
jgi:hypothetical protein